MPLYIARDLDVNYFARGKLFLHKEEPNFSNGYFYSKDAMEFDDPDFEFVKRGECYQVTNFQTKIIKICGD